MINPLDGIEAKLARADFHLERVKSAIEPIVEAEADLIPGEFDPESGRYLFRALRDGRSGSWLSPIIGDCVHNYRAALDYLVWALTTAEVRSSKYASKIEFPIYTDPDGFNGAVERKLRGVGDEARAVIKCLQPFNGPNCRPDFSLAHPTEKPLWHLFELEKWDKHRSLNLTDYLASYGLDLPRELAIYTSPEPVRMVHHFQRGTVIARLALRTDQRDVEMYLRATYDVAFDGEGPESVATEPVLKTLDDIRKEIRFRVVPGLSRLVPP